MPQYWFGILDVLVPSSYSMTADPGTTPFLLITLMASKCVIGMFTQLNISLHYLHAHVILFDN